jgi:hypothetical protein
MLLPATCMRNQQQLNTLFENSVFCDTLLPPQNVDTVTMMLLLTQEAESTVVSLALNSSIS